MPYTKPFLSLPDQLALIKTRGLRVDDDAAAIACLRRNGYYRLSAYWYPFREIQSGARIDVFLPDSHFEDAVKLYQFDKSLKLVLLDAIERVEIAVRVEIALTLGRRNPFALETPSTFHTTFTAPDSRTGKSKYDDWFDRYSNQVARSRDEFVKHYERRYGSRTPLPIWIGIELWDFGMLSHAFSGLKNADKVDVAKKFGIPEWKLMSSWLRSLNYVRNVIAHHGRLWNLNLDDSPSLPKLGQMSDFDILVPMSRVSTRIYSICCILSYMTNVINPESDWTDDFQDRVVAFPAMPYAHITDMGFPTDWQTHPFWFYKQK